MKNFFKVAFSAFALMTSAAAYAGPDFDTAETDEEKYAACKGLYAIAKMAAEMRDNGKDEDEVLKVTDDVASESGYGWKTKHVMETAVKGAYLHTDQTPRQYAADTQVSCQNNWK